MPWMILSYLNCLNPSLWRKRTCQMKPLNRRTLMKASNCLGPSFPFT